MKWDTLAFNAVLATVFLVVSCCGAALVFSADEVVAPVSIEGATTATPGGPLEYLTAVTDDPAGCGWLPIQPRGLDPGAFVVIDGGKRLVVDIPCQPTVIEVQLIDYVGRSHAFHTITVGGTPPPPPPPPVDTLTIRIFHDGSGTDWDDVWKDFRDAANPFEGDLRIVRVPTQHEVDAQYAAGIDLKNGPMLILDSDDDPSQILEARLCPTAPDHPNGTRAAIEAAIERYQTQAAGSSALPIPGQEHPDIPEAYDVGNQTPPRNDATVEPTPAADQQPTRDDFEEYIDLGGQRVMRHKDTGQEYPIKVNDQGVEIFCLGDRCLEVRG